MANGFPQDPFARIVRVNWGRRVFHTAFISFSTFILKTQIVQASINGITMIDGATEFPDIETPNLVVRRGVTVGGDDGEGGTTVYFAGGEATFRVLAPFSINILFSGLAQPFPGAGFAPVLNIVGIGTAAIAESSGSVSYDVALNGDVSNFQASFPF
jgi:hypothetical protein